jgi:ParB family transcriptional regulator, chromosome partitioning protein
MPTHPVAATIQQIPLDQIVPSPYQARKTFDETALKDLSESMKEEGLVQPIVVRKIPPSPSMGEGEDGGGTPPPSSSPTRGEEMRFELVSGERRLRAAKMLGWQTIEAVVRDDVKDQDSALQGLIENLQREDLSPFEAAEGFQSLSKPPYGLTQEDLAKRVGMSRGTVSQYFMIAGLDQKVREIAKRLANLEFGHILQLCRLKDPEEQTALAQDANKKELSVKELKALVDKKLAETGQLRSRRKTKIVPPPPVDPLAGVWKGVREGQGIPFSTYWLAKYGEHREGKVSSLGWFFFVAPGQPEANTDAQRRADLAIWFGQMLKAIRGEKLEEAVSQAELDVTRSTLEVERNMAEIVRLRGAGATPKTTRHPRPLRRGEKGGVRGENPPAMDADFGSQPKLPATPAEWTEAEAAAKKGPGPLYAWVYGPDSFFAKKMAAMSWQDLHESDPVAACHKVVDGIRKLPV